LGDAEPYKSVFYLLTYLLSDLQKQIHTEKLLKKGMCQFRHKHIGLTALYTQKGLVILSVDVEDNYCEIVSVSH